MKVGLDRRRNLHRRSSSSGEMDQASVHQKVDTIAAVMTAHETVPADDSFSLGSMDSLSSKDHERTVSTSVVTEDQHCAKQKRDAEKMQKYMQSREMTSMQEKWNAITILPGPIYCIYYLLNGKWVNEMHASNVTLDENFDRSQCFTTPWLPFGVPPFPVVFIAVAICLHAPFSFLYHWVYAHSLAPVARIAHWSRRLDHVFIHVASAFCSYGTSGNLNYFLANVMYNADCMHRQFQKKVRPRQNQMRIFCSILAYTIPILNHGNVSLFCKSWVVVLISGWLFATYPLKGWSHSMFHVVIAFLPPLLFQAAMELPVSKEHIATAVQCAIADGRGVVE